MEAPSSCLPTRPQLVKESTSNRIHSLQAPGMMLHTPTSFSPQESQEVDATIAPILQMRKLTLSKLTCFSIPSQLGAEQPDLEIGSVSPRTCAKNRSVHRLILILSGSYPCRGQWVAELVGRALGAGLACNLA